jgi:hypothetical protein
MRMSLGWMVCALVDRRGSNSASSKTGASGDATFPNYIFLASYGYRFGSKSGKSDTAICPIDHKENH